MRKYMPAGYVQKFHGGVQRVGGSESYGSQQAESIFMVKLKGAKREMCISNSFFANDFSVGTRFPFHFLPIKIR